MDCLTCSSVCVEVGNQEDTWSLAGAQPLYRRLDRSEGASCPKATAPQIMMANPLRKEQGQRVKNGWINVERPGVLK
jgi:hypothetical protein